MAKTAAHRAAAVAAYLEEAVGPRQVGGTYYSGYWGTTYRVDAIHTGDEARQVLGMASDWAIIETDLDGPSKNHPRTHCTPWHRRDRVIQQPPG